MNIWQFSFQFSVFDLPHQLHLVILDIYNSFFPQTTIIDDNFGKKRQQKMKKTHYYIQHNMSFLNNTVKGEG